MIDAGDYYENEKPAVQAFISAMASEIASVELKAARIMARRNDGTLVFPWDCTAPEDTACQYRKRR